MLTGVPAGTFGGPAKPGVIPATKNPAVSVPWVIIEPNASHPQRRLISNPRSIFRTTRLLTRFIGPVETFQTMDELLAWAKESRLDCEAAQFTESEYDRLTVRQALQKIYARVLKPVLPEKYLHPNYFLSFRKPA